VELASIATENGKPIELSCVYPFEFYFGTLTFLISVLLRYPYTFNFKNLIIFLFSFHFQWHSSTILSERHFGDGNGEGNGFVNGNDDGKCEPSAAKWRRHG